MVRKAYSYIRFSSGRQAKGDSLRRQTEATEAYCRRNGLELDPSTMRDLGVSGYSGANVTKGALAGFLEAVKCDKVPSGSVLIVESLDRLSRAQVRDALALFLAIQAHGIDIATTTPERLYRADNPDALALIEPLILFARAHEESLTKGKRVSEAYHERRRKAMLKADGGVVSGMLPAWCRREGNRIVLDEKKADAVRRVFALAGSGYGCNRIVEKLDEEHIPAIGKGPKWVRCYIGKLITDRRTLGEYAPRKGKGRKDDGEVIPHYFPPVVTPEQFYAARAGAEERKTRGGRRSGTGMVNLWHGLAKDRVSGQPLWMHQTNRWGKLTVYLAAGGMGRGRLTGLPLAVVDAALLSMLREIKADEVFGGAKADMVEALKGELKECEARMAALEVELDTAPDLAPLTRALQRQTSRKAELTKEIEKAEREAAQPLQQAWQGVPSLVDALATAADQEDARRRLQSALRKAIKCVWVLIVPDGTTQQRYAEVMVEFEGGGVRVYYLHFRPSSRSRPHGEWWAMSVPMPSELPDGRTYQPRILTPEESAERALKLIECIREVMAADEDVRRLMGEGVGDADLALDGGLIGTTRMGVIA